MGDFVTLSDDDEVQIIGQVINVEPIIVDLTNGDTPIQRRSRHHYKQKIQSPSDAKRSSNSNEDSSASNDSHKSAQPPSFRDAQSNGSTYIRSTCSSNVQTSRASNVQPPRDPYVQQSGPTFLRPMRSFFVPQSRPSNVQTPLQKSAQFHPPPSYSSYTTNAQQPFQPQARAKPQQQPQPQPQPQQQPSQPESQHKQPHPQQTPAPPQSQSQPQSHSQSFPQFQQQPNTNVQPQPQINILTHEQTQLGSTEARQSPPPQKNGDMTERELMISKKESGNEKYKTGQYDDAIRIYREARELARKLDDRGMLAILHFNLAMTYEKTGAINQAIDEFAAAVKYDDNYYKAHYKRADLYMHQNKFEEAVICYEHLCEIDSKSVIYATHRIQEARHLAKLSRKKDHYELLGLNPNFTIEDLRKAYKQKARNHHPDKHSDADIVTRRIQERIFKDISEAYSFFQKRFGYR